MYLSRLKELQPCWWCGEAAGHWCERVDRYDSDGWPSAHLYDRHHVRCTRCRCMAQSYESKHQSYGSVYGEDDPKQKAIDEWNAGHVSIPLMVDLPQTHHVLERKLLPTKWNHVKPSEMTILIPKTRGIAEHFQKMLSVVYVSDKEIRPHRFRLNERDVIHWNCTLLHVTNTRGCGNTEFRFRSTDSDWRVNSRSRVDTAWLNRPVERAPVFDAVFKAIQEEVADAED